MEFNLDLLVRNNIKAMAPYSSARHEYGGMASIFLDANENAFGSPLAGNYNRYPDPLQLKLKEKLSQVKDIQACKIFLGNGSDEAIDLLFRIFCEPGRDNVIICPPTYGMYEVCAAVNNVRVKNVSLTNEFQLDLKGIAKGVNDFSKIIFICSPNNPTGNSINKKDIEAILEYFNGLIIIDEAYINYAEQESFITKLSEYPNLVVLQTLSKAWGLAGLRLGMAFANEPVINYLNKIKYPYNISTTTQQLTMEALNNILSVQNWTKTTIEQREKLKEELLKLSFTQIVYPSDANFILVKMTEAKKIYEFLSAKGIIVRDRSNVLLCENCLRITIGTPEENKKFIETIKQFIV